MALQVSYEWAIETVDEHDDIIDVDHADTLAEARHRLDSNQRQQIALVRDTGSDLEGLCDRQWAYLENGKLPEAFDGGAKIPKRFFDEIKRTA